jgi:hypothetical protein
LRVLLWPLLLAAGHGAARAQSAADHALPSAPEPGAAADTQKTGIISGTVIDTNGSVIQGATVTLLQNWYPRASLQSGSNGQFSFSELPAGNFTVTVTGKNMRNVSSPEIALSAGEVNYLKPIVLPVEGGTTSVVVTATQDELAEEEVHIEESQRVLGIVPNFFESFDWNAHPLNSKQKFHLAWR